MNDRELLDMAAKAAGIELIGGSKTPMVSDDGDLSHMREWRPLTDDGDALRLAVKLKLQIRPNDYDVMVVAQLPAHITVVEACDYKDPYAATRRAIVRAAAEIGRGMK